MKFVRVFTILVLITLSGCQQSVIDQQPLLKPDHNLLNSMKIVVARDDNRAVSFTNKRSAFYYTNTHLHDHAEHNWFRGLNIAQKRIFSGYTLALDGKALVNSTAVANVFPHKLERVYPNNIIETLELFDQQDALKISLAGGQGQLELTLLGEQVDLLAQTAAAAFYTTKEKSNTIIAVAPIRPGRLVANQHQISADANLNGFYLVVADDQQQALALIAELRLNGNTWLAQRQQRMTALLTDNNYLASDSNELTLAMRWITSTMDQLMTQQGGYGIYAGLPWFNEYWGRDTFIALPGASLVTGQFAWARNIITAFAQFQQTDPNSKFYGRVPNRVKPDDINYHTTDGTPRFIIQMREYVQYSGDTSLIEQMYPAIKMSIEGALSHWVDQQGYLLHEDNETWMDARRAADLMPYSPRGTRANDIQALWYGQLQAGVYFARFMNDPLSALKWQAIADKLQQHFVRDFRLAGKDYLADRLDQQDHADEKLRPNQLYAFDLLDDPLFKVRATRKVWQELVYPWGVASLDRHDPFFHPFHLNPAFYHKDQAYHNGTIWLWNNGAAMQRMIEAGQTDMAYQLFTNMNKFALQRGVVGGLAENANAYPKKGEQWPTLTGTYLQAWSNAEHLRVFYQHFLGIRPDMINQKITLAPRIPTALNRLNYRVKIANGLLHGEYHRDAKQSRYHYRFEGIGGQIEVDFAHFDITSLTVQPGEQLEILRSEQQLHLTLLSAKGDDSRVIILKPSLPRTEQLAQWHVIMEGVKFAVPLSLEQHPVMQRQFN